MKATKKSLYALFLAGSLCSFNTQASNDKEVEHRLQITGATREILAAIDASNIDVSGKAPGTVIVGGTTYTPNTNDLTSLSLGVSAVEGAGFTAANSLVNLATHADALAIEAAQAVQGVGPLATAAVIGSPLVNATASTVALVLGDPTASTPSASASLAAALGAIEGTNAGQQAFTAALAGLIVIAKQTALAQVIAAESNPTLVSTYTAGTGGTGFSGLNTNLAAISTAITTAMTAGGQNNTNIIAIRTATTTAITNVITAAGAPYSAQAVTAGLETLLLAVNNWLAFYPN